MVILTQKEKEALLILFKDFTNFYNANSISKLLDISHVGAQKIFKRLLKQNLLMDRKIGKSIVYKLKLEDDYVRKLIAFLLADEANSFKRWKEEFRELSKKAKIVILYGSAIKNYSKGWKEEFKELFKKDRIIMIYGSVIKNYVKANDIDIMIVIRKAEYKEVTKIIEKKQKILPKKIHSIELTANDLLQNIKQKKKSVIDMVKNAIILYGQDKYVEIIKNVASF